MKKVIAVLLSVVMLACLLPCFAVSVSADALYIRKVVSVVYDDSGSMNHYDGSKWANANYAMQAFCGMLNAEDKLYISYMSEVTEAMDNGKADQYVPQEVDLSSGGIQRSVNHIRNLTKASDYTPFKAVERAYHQLTQVQDSNPNTQYWLVIITDGGFNKDGDPNTTKELDKRLGAYAKAKMPNGTNPQITFMGIEQSSSSTKLPMPTNKPGEGIYTYSAKDSNQIIGVMSDMAAQISGRSRVAAGAVQKVNDTTLRVSSEIPLLNIAVLSQRTDAKVTYACYTGEGEIKRSRQAALRYDRNPKFTDLLGSACLVGDSQQVIMAGSYDITFDKAVNLNDVVVLFEPALETRMTISVNGTPVTDYTELQNTMAGDKISVSCKLYEMGTNNEVSPSLLPPGTKFQILINENGQQVVCEVGQEMVLDEYELKNLDTEVVAQVIIEGFRPIEYRETFTPAPYVPRVVYTMDVAYGSGTQSVKLDNIGTNTDLTLVYTVYADGVPMTNPAEVQALKPTVSVSPAGNNGVLTYSADGKIIFTPNVAPQPAAGVDSFEVQATCTLENGVSATQKYTVLVALYEIFPLTVNGTIRKNEFYGNTVGASFYITKDGVRLTKSQVESQAAGVLNDTYSHLDTRIEVTADGTITVIPHAAEEHKMFWLFNWWWYWFDLPGEDVSVTLSHPYGTATTPIDVVEADTGYIIWNVIAPLVVCILLLILIAMYIWGDLTQPWFQSGRALYVGNLRFEPNQGGYEGNRGHAVSGVTQYNLTAHNCWWWYLVPYPITVKVPVDEYIEVSPTRGAAINCHFRTWMRIALRPVNSGVHLNHPDDLMRVAGDFHVLHVKEIQLRAEHIDDEQMMETTDSGTYWIAPGPDGLTKRNNITTITNAKVVAYADLQE